jgi:HK97 family phage portal protein
MLANLRMGMRLALGRVVAAYRGLTSGIANPQQWLVDWWGGGASYAGPVVNESTALNYSAMWACVRVASETVGSLPLHLYRRLPNGGRELAVKHPLNYLLQEEPNPEMTSVRWRTAAQAHIETWGNHYCLKEYDGAGRIIGLWPLKPGQMTIKRNPETRLIEYHYTGDDGTLYPFPASWILHVPGWGYDGLVGYSPVQMAKQAIGLGLATEEFGARFFGSGAHPSGIFERPAKDVKALSIEAAARLKADLAKQYAGIGKAGGIMLLEEGLTFKSIDVPNDTAQFLQTRAFQLSEMARIHRLPPHKVGDLEHATFSNIEHQAIEFVTDSILPRIVLWEQELNRSLLLPRERGEFYFKHNLAGLLRGDTKSRYEAYKIAREGGWLSEEEIREFEDMNPVGFETFLVPANMDRYDRDGKQIPRIPAATQSSREHTPASGRTPPEADVPPSPDGNEKQEN